MKRKVIGVVDNDPGMLKALQRLLIAHGFDVKLYISAEALLESGSMHDELTCLLLDINLDGMSGIQLRRQLAASGRELPIIFMTAFDSPQTHQDAIDAGCIAYLLKPFPATALIGAIANASC